MKETDETSYGVAICQGFEYLLENYEDVFIMGQGLWSPWYVGNSMTDLDVKFGAHRVIDTPVSESACTGAAVGASLAGMRPIVVHPRMDFMLYAMDAVVNQAAKWSSMVGGQANPGLTIRGIINRGGAGCSTFSVVAFLVRSRARPQSGYAFICERCPRSFNFSSLKSRSGGLH